LVWFGFSLGCLPRKRPLAFAAVISSEVRTLIRPDSNSASMPNTLNSSRPSRIGGIVDSAAEAELGVSPRELVEDVTGVWQRAGEPVQLPYHQGVARPTGGQRQPQSWTVATCAGEAVIDVDAVITDTERMEAVALSGEILLLC
jgi:hypothetical protein